MISAIPRTVRYLSIQLDGASENWNKTVLGYTNFLVECGRFDEVQLNSKWYSQIFSHVSSSWNSFPGLPVGHTHEDIDQVFSVISRALLGGPKRDSEVVLNTRDDLFNFLSNEVFAIVCETMLSLSRPSFRWVYHQVFKSGVTLVRRITTAYDAVTFFSGKLNPNLHGLGHSGWDLWVDRKNPTHCIRFSRNGKM